MNIEELAKNLGLEKEEYLELIELFVDKGMSDLDELQSAIETGDAEKAASAAHSLKGAAGSLGLMDIHEATKKIEIEALQGSLGKALGPFQTLKKALKGTATLVQSVLAP